MNVVLYTSFIVLLYVMGVIANGRVSRIGNPIKSSVSGVDVPGATFLINDIVLRDGVLYAYRAYFRSDEPVHFQVWRPEGAANNGKQDFRLISDVRMIPSVVNAVEDIYMVSKFLDCVVVQGGDRLGLFFEGTNGAVSYTFDGADPRVFGATLDLDDLPDVDDLVEFDSLIFPYDFSIAAYVDTDLSRYGSSISANHTVECPDDLLIPDYDIVDDVTPEPPVTGAPGATGATGPAGPRGGPGLQGATGPTGEAGATGEVGPMGAVGATGAAGPQGLTGASGSDGLVGATGPQGVKGERGEQGPPGPPGPAGGETSHQNSTHLQVTEAGAPDMMIWILLAWSLLLTIILIVVVISIACVVRKHREHCNKTSDVESPPARPNLDWREKSKRKSLKSWINPHLSWRAHDDKDSETASDVQLKENEAAPDVQLKDSESASEVQLKNATAVDVQPADIDSEQDVQLRNNDGDGTRGAVNSGYEDEENWMGTMKSTTETTYSNETLNR